MGSVVEKENIQLYTEHCCVVNDLIQCAKGHHFSSIMESNQGDQKILFQAVNNLLYRKIDCTLSLCGF